MHGMVEQTIAPVMTEDLFTVISADQINLNLKKSTNHGISKRNSKSAVTRRY
jgi:hypothetical protein